MNHRIRSMGLKMRTWSCTDLPEKIWGEKVATSPGAGLGPPKMNDSCHGDGEVESILFPQATDSDTEVPGREARFITFLGGDLFVAAFGVKRTQMLGREAGTVLFPLSRWDIIQEVPESCLHLKNFQ